MTDEEYNSSPYMRMDTVVLELYDTYFKYSGISLKVLRVAYDSYGNPIVVDVAQNYPSKLITVQQYFDKL